MHRPHPVPPELSPSLCPPEHAQKTEGRCCRHQPQTHDNPPDNPSALHIYFLFFFIKILNLQDVEAVHARAEDYIKDNREKFDYAVARAVAPLNTLLEYLVPYVKVGGECLIYKSQKLEEEIETSQNALKVLGCKVEKIESFNIDEIDAARKILIIKKCFVTPIKYPRGKNLPKTKPI